MQAEPQGAENLRRKSSQIGSTAQAETQRTRAQTKNKLLRPPVLSARQRILILQNQPQTKTSQQTVFKLRAKKSAFAQT